MPDHRKMWIAERTRAQAPFLLPEVGIAVARGRLGAEAAAPDHVGWAHRADLGMKRLANSPESLCNPPAATDELAV